MSFTLETIVPWGRSFDEYVAMFSLTERDLQMRILGCADGPASFNSDLTKRGGTVISVDPIYQFSGQEIEDRIAAAYQDVMEEARKNRGEFIWKYIETVEELGLIRFEAMKKFITDYSTGDDRYINSALPTLPFRDRGFDIALCSHFLFLYSEQLSFEFHIRSLKELCRVATEIRIFPLLELGAQKSRHLKEVVQALEKDRYECEIEKVAYEFQKGGNQMLRVKSSNE